MDYIPLWLAVASSIVSGLAGGGFVVGVMRTRINMCYMELEHLRHDINKAHERIDDNILGLARRFREREKEQHERS